MAQRCYAMQKHFENGVKIKQTEKETARVQVKQGNPRVQGRREMGMMVDHGIYNLEKLKRRRDDLSKQQFLGFVWHCLITRARLKILLQQ